MDGSSKSSGHLPRCAQRPRSRTCARARGPGGAPVAVGRRGTGRSRRFGWLGVVLVGLSAVLWTSAAAAKRRAPGAEAQGSLVITLKKPARFGDVRVASGRYRLTLAKGQLVLADPKSMRVLGRLPTQRRQAEAVVSPARVERRCSGERVTLRLHHLNRLYIAAGKRDRATAPAKSLVDLAKKQEKQVKGAIPKPKTAAELVARALARYETSLEHCIARAHRNRWKSDDPALKRCICPLVRDWRLPKTQPPVRLHRHLARGTLGYSLTAGPAGHANNCRVWVGPKPPKRD